MKILQLIVLSTAIVVSSAAAQSVTPAEIKVLEGAEGVGELTYLDYSSNEKTSIKSNLKVSATGDVRAWQFSYIYPKEPQANETSDVKLSTDGRTFNDQKVIEKSKLPDGTLKIVATENGTDNDRKSLFRFTYLIGKSKFSVKKEVRVDGTETFFERNTYSWSR